MPKTGKYPRLKALKIKVRKHPSGGCRYVRWDEVHAALDRWGEREWFSDLFGVQTCCDLGPYPGDVEAVLEVMLSGRKTGTQLLMD